MKKTISQRFFLSLCLMIVGCLWGSAAWAAPGDVVYTLTCSKNSSNTDYARNYDVTINGLSWNAPGNQTLGNYWRIGGKSLNKVDRTITGKSPISSAISKVTLAHKGISNANAKINSVSLTVASDANFTKDIETVTINSPSLAEGVAGTMDFTPTSGNWPTGSYYKLTINITNSNTKSSYGLDITSLTFYEGASGPALTTSTNSISFGSVEVNNNAVNNFTISGTKLTPSSTASLTIDDNTNFSVTPSTIDIDANGDIAAKNVTVTYAPTAAGVHNATLTISSGNLEKMVTLTGTGFVPHYISATTYYKKITSSDELADGGQYVIVYTGGMKGLLAGEKKIDDATPANVVFEDNGTISTANAAAMTEITFEHNAGANYYLNIGNSKYIKAVSSTKTDLNVATDKDDKDNNALWTIDFDAEGNVEITSVAYKTRGIFYKTTNSFKNYAISNRGDAGYPAIQLYQKVGEMPIAKATGYVSTYVADFAYVMPKHITGHTVTLAAEQGVISTKKVFRAGDEVPALTPLLIKSDEDYAAEENSRNYHPAVLNKTVKAYKDDNMLEYRRTAANLTNTMKNESVYYYKLAIKEGKVGFYWGADNGAAFKMTKPSTAYLTVPQRRSVQGFVLNLEEGATTGIATVVTNEDAPIYNLQGIRMNGKNLPKGIYIQGGKKFMVK